jgi:amidohydrolase
MHAKDRARAHFEAAEPHLVEISHWMYDHPEIAFEERETSARLAGFLREAGFAVEHPAYGLETAFAARAGEDGPHVVVCAEYDALPGVGHACGHNIIATAALGAGAALRPLVDELGIRLTVLGTPAEEKYGGKVDLIQAGAFDGVDAAMMIHPTPSDVVDQTMIAVQHIDVLYHGKTAHASGWPHLGINALDAFVQAYVNISTLRQHILPTDRIHGIITHGGDAPNIVPDFTRSSWYVRSSTRARLDELLPRVMACFEAAATATGCRLEVEQVGHPYDEVLHDPVMVELFATNAEALGRPMGRGADRDAGETGSTDMGNVSRIVPSIHPMLSIHSAPAVNHQAEFAAHTVTADGDRAIRDGALAMAWTVIDLAEMRMWDDLGAGR